MRPARNEAETLQKGDVAAVHEESSGDGGEGHPASDRRPEPRVDTDDHTPEEAGYGYGV
jgi:hypothetical protein